MVPRPGQTLGRSDSGQPVPQHERAAPPSTGSSEIRMLFAFDPAREVIFLVAGDKSGNWNRGYKQAIPIADERYTEHLIDLKEDES